MMAIEKSSVKSPTTGASMSSSSRESMSSEDDEVLRKGGNQNGNYQSVVGVVVDSEEEEDDDDEFDDADSGAGSDDFDLLELGETGSEFCQVEDQTCSIPYELYDLPDLSGVLSLEVWNECLTEEERFGLTKYLPDMDQETFMNSLKELFEGGNFHFGSPVKKLFEMLKGGLCEPRVSLYRQGLVFFQKHQHYHLIRKHQDSLVGSLLEMQEAWKNCKGFSIEEKLRVLNVWRSQKSLMNERNDEMGLGSSDREYSDEGLWSKKRKLKGKSFGQRAGDDSFYAVSPPLDNLPQGRSVAVDSPKFGRKHPKSAKMVSSRSIPQYEQAPHEFARPRAYQEMMPDTYGSDMPLSRKGKAASYDAMAARQMKEQIASDDVGRMMYGMPHQREWNVAQCNMMDRGRSYNPGKMQDVYRGDGYDGNGYSSLSFPINNEYSGNGRNMNINQLSDIQVLTAKPSSMRGLRDPSMQGMYGEPAYEGQFRPTKGRGKQMGVRGHRSDFVDVEQPYWSNGAPPGEAYLADPSYDYEHADISGRRLKIDREPFDPRYRAVQASQQQFNDRNYQPNKRARLQENLRGNAMLNGGSSMLPLKSGRMFRRGEDTESISSLEVGDDDDNSPLIMTKLAVQNRLENPRSSLSRTDRKKDKRVKKEVREIDLANDGLLAAPNAPGDYRSPFQIPGRETSPFRSRQKAKMQQTEILQNYTPNYYELGRNGMLQAELAAGFPMSMNTASPLDRRQMGNVGHDFYYQPNYLQDYPIEEVAGPMAANGLSMDMTLAGLASSIKKQKGKTEPSYLESPDYMQSHQELFETVSGRKRVKKRPEASNGPPDAAGTSEPPVVEVETVEIELELKPQKKSYPLITPTVHTGFSFSIIHLLSAVRMALVTPNLEDPLELGKQIENTGEKSGDQSEKPVDMNESVEPLDVKNPVDMNESVEPLDVKNAGTQEEQKSLPSPSLTIQEIVDRVKLNPGDPCILETQEPLKDLVRGVLKILLSRTAPLGAKGWKPLVSYEKSTKSWSWIGPAVENSADNEVPEEVTSPDAWNIPYKMLVKLVDSFANWLKCGQETLQQIGSLPAPPLELMQLDLDEKERFKDLRAQKSLVTISPSSDEFKAYFRKEEQLRYSIPDRAFSYTAADGKKSIVAPLRRCGGKPTSKAREHFMLKHDRPPHVTILCLVRDAAARLPGSIGTRADVCTLIKDSQYIVETTPDERINQVVSGALDRLHYERDPCVLYDAERKLWVYLHREREEEDFEDDGTSSTKKWKRQKKDPSELDDQVTVACDANGEQSGFDLSADLNVEPSGVEPSGVEPSGVEPSDINNDSLLEVVCDDTRQITENDGETNQMEGRSVFLRKVESKLECQEHSADEDIDDST